MTESGRLADRVAVVTGGGAGIGRAIARRFAQEGAHVVVAEISSESGQAVAAELRSAGGDARAVPTDVTDEESVSAMLAATTSEYGRVDVLVNNAVSGPADDLLTIDAARWDADVTMSLRSAFLCMKGALPIMIERGRGSIVNIASVNAFGFLGNEAYSAAKAGVVNLTMSVAARYGQHGIRANAVAPGTVRTERWEHRLARDPDVLNRLAKWYPLGRVGKPEDVANAALFLASDEAAWITGTVLPVDGGLLSGNLPMARELLVETYGQSSA